MKYLTVEYTHVECGWTTRVRTKVPVGREHHALFYRQAISKERCFKCQQAKNVANCICWTCLGQGQGASA